MAPSTTPEPSSARQAKGRRTCLYCYHPWRVERAPEACPQCGQTQSRQEQELYWTQEPQLLGWQRGLRVAAVLVALALAAALARIMDAASLPWGLALVAAVGSFLWYSAGSLTRRQSFVDLRYLWPLILLGVALGPLVISGALRAIRGEPLGWESLWSGLLWMGPWLVPLVISLWLPGRYSRFRMERMGARVYSPE